MNTLSEMINMLGGNVEDIFVIKPGCKILNMQNITSIGEEIFDKFNIDTNRPKYEQSAEFNSRLTYLSFKKQQERNTSSEQFNHDMVEKYKHLSVYGNQYITFLIAGITIETIIELVSTREAQVSRLTTSKTKSMNKTLYRIFDEKQKKSINDFIKIKESLDVNFNDQEEKNMFNLGLKVSALTFCMSLKDFHKFFIGRMTPNNEKEVIELCEIMVNELREHYPLIIKEPNFYKGCNNGEKLNIF